MSSKPYSFFIEGKPLCAKKFKSNENLSKVRIALKSKIDSSILFLNGDDAPIDIEDEQDFTLENIDKAGKIYLSHSNGELKSFQIYSDGNFLINYQGNENENIKNIRKTLENKINKDFLFLLKNESKIEKEDENDEDGFSLSDIEKDGIIYITTGDISITNNSNVGNKNENNAYEQQKFNNDNNNKILYSFILGNKIIYTSSFLPEYPLYLVRKELKNKIDDFQNLSFSQESKIISKEEEFEVEIKDISVDKIIFLERNNNFQSEVIYINKRKVEENLIPKPGHSDKFENTKKEATFYFEIENGKKFVKVLNPNENLSIIRGELKDHISDDIIFIYDGYEIERNDEKNYTLSLIQNNSKVSLRKQLINNNDSGTGHELTAAPIIKNQPIKGSKLITEKNGLKIYKYPEIQFSPEEEIRSISLMVVGQTGSGKTTLLNSFVNYLLGIRLEDDFRYKIIFEENDGDQSKSVTQNVTVYRISTNGKYPPIKIIDSPGYGDTGGIERDIQITELIKQKFEKEIDTINAICFVAQSSNARLTANQRYIFDSIINLFGNDIAENFIVMMTFCDGQDPQLKDALISKESNLKPIISLIKYPWYLKFNNSAIFASNKDNFNELFWKLGMESFAEFMKKLMSLPAKSLTLTKEVLNKRKHLKTTVEMLIPQLNLGLSKLESIRQQLQKIDLEKKKIDGSKNFIIESDVPKFNEVKLKTGEYVTNCIICNYTCHYPCYIAEDKEKNDCSAMTAENCTVCPKKCHYTHHRNAPFRIEIKMVKEKTTLKDLEKKFYDSKSNLSRFEQIRNGLYNEFRDIQVKCLKVQDEIKKSVDRLKQIGLNSNPLSQNDYIDLLIESEKNQRKPGWQGRIRGLEDLKRIHQTIKEAYESKNNRIKKFSDFEEQYLKEMSQNYEKDNNNCLIF
jgi:hypothetical protein